MMGELIHCDPSVWRFKSVKFYRSCTCTNNYCCFANHILLLLIIMPWCAHAQSRCMYTVVCLCVCLSRLATTAAQGPMKCK